MIRIDAIWLATEPMDMRAGTEAALARVIAVFGAAKPHCAYLFANRRANRMKVLVHDGVGNYCSNLELEATMVLLIAPVLLIGTCRTSGDFNGLNTDSRKDGRHQHAVKTKHDGKDTRGGQFGCQVAVTDGQAGDKSKVDTFKCAPPFELTDDQTEQRDNKNEH